MRPDIYHELVQARTTDLYRQGRRDESARTYCPFVSGIKGGSHEPPPGLIQDRRVA